MGKKSIRREVMCLYRALLKRGKILNLYDMIDLQERYTKLYKDIMTKPEAPRSLKSGLLPPLGIPKYLKWAKQFLTRKKNEEICSKN